MIADTVPDVVVRQDWRPRPVKHRGRPALRPRKLSLQDLADRREVAAETLEALSESFWREAHKRAK
jgi:hypothetical protein